MAIKNTLPRRSSERENTFQIPCIKFLRLHLELINKIVIDRKKQFFKCC